MRRSATRYVVHPLSAKDVRDQRRGDVLWQHLFLYVVNYGKSSIGVYEKVGGVRM